MRILLLPLVLLAALSLGGCGSEDGDAVGRDPSGSAAKPEPMPTAVPSAEGLVATRNVALVMDTGRPELCLGPVAESWPPQCGGPHIVNWDWRTHGREMFERHGDIRWGQYHLTGRWDGTSFTVEDAVPAALYDPMAVDPTTEPPARHGMGEAELRAIAEEVGRLPGAGGANATAGRVHVDVTYDDGSLQAWADQTYGDDVVRVTSMLVDVR